MKIKLRSEVNQKLTWDLGSIFKTEADYLQAIERLKQVGNEIEKKYQNNLNSAQNINNCLDEYKNYLQLLTVTSTYASLNLSSDQTNPDNTSRMMNLMNIITTLESKLSFINSELIELDEMVINAAITSSEANKCYLQNVLYRKKHALSSDVEKVLTSLSQPLNAFYQIYNQSKLADMNFSNFIVEENEYPLSFVLFENKWEYETDTQVRRTAFRKFSEKLSEYQHTFAALYQAQVQKEKVTATLRGFDSVFDYLLFNQKVEKDLYNRQIDIIMDKLAPHMRKYAELLKRVHKLDEMTFADLKLSADPNFEPSITVEESKTYVENALSVMGDDYLAMVKRAYDERWIDFVANKGKSTGAFCSSPYGVHPYILISWNEQMREAFVLAHELGHAGHFYLAQQKQNILNTRPSQYFIEAPSTMNEMLMANYLIKTNNDPRFMRWVYATMISRTYYHNFVTHLLEAAYQREVYRIIDQGGSIHAHKLNQIKREVLEKFWGETVIINEGAELTWMRQPHYYMGLYPYTYSAGLTISTQVSKRIVNEGQQAILDWRQVLEAGGTKTPVELAQMAGVDITTEKPLLDTIEHIGNIITEIIKLTNIIDAENDNA